MTILGFPREHMKQNYSVIIFPILAENIRNEEHQQILQNMTFIGIFKRIL